MDAKTKQSEKKGKDKANKLIDADGNVVLITENDGAAQGLANPTKLTEESDEGVCRICWGTEEEDRAN